MSVIAATQTAFINRLKAVRTASSDKDYPVQIKPYSGELVSHKNINYSSSVYVDVSNAGTLDATDQLGEIHTGSYVVELIVFDKNLHSAKDTFSGLAKLIDWTIDAIKGQVLTINGVPVIAGKNIQWGSVTDYKVPFAIVRVTLTIQEDIQ